MNGCEPKRDRSKRGNIIKGKIKKMRNKRGNEN